MNEVAAARTAAVETPVVRIGNNPLTGVPLRRDALEWFGQLRRLIAAAHRYSDR